MLLIKRLVIFPKEIIQLISQFVIVPDHTPMVTRTKKIKIKSSRKDKHYTKHLITNRHFR